MFYQRKEGFRFRFPIPHDAELSIVNGAPLQSPDNHVKMLDISLGGAKVACSGLNIRYEDQPKQVILSFLLNGKSFSLPGQMIWKQLYLGEYLYGIKFQRQKESQAELLKELKIYAKNRTSKQPEAGTS